MVTRRDVLLGCGSALAFLAIPRSALAAAARIYRVPIRLQSGRLAVSCMIEGKGPFELGIDTGSLTSIITADLAKRLDLKQHGVTPLGIAGRYQNFPMFEAREIIFGSAFRQERVLFAGIDFPLGRDVVGMLAAGCLTTMDAELDFSAMQWRLYPDGGPDRTGWVAHERAIQTNDVGSPHLYGQVSLGGQKLRCLFDTGAPGSISIFSKVARKCGIDVDRQNWSPVMAGGKPRRLYRASAPIEIGGLRIERPLVLVEDEFPNFIEDGLVGLSLIQRLNLATEVQAARLWTRPNGNPGRPDRYNLSGLWIDEKGRDIKATMVGRGSPAEQAGIVAGDRIDGEFRDLIRQLGGRPGDPVSLAVVRGSQRREVTLVLREYL